MRTRGEVELDWCSPGTEYPVGCRIAIGRCLMRKIRHRQGTLIECRFDVPELAIQRFDFFTRDLESLHEIVSRLFGPLTAGHLVVGGVTLRFQALDPDQHVAPLAVEL